MKKIFFAIPVLVLLLVGVFFFVGETNTEDIDVKVQSEHKDEVLYVDDKVVYLKEGNAYEKVDSFDEEVINISWSDDGRYFSLDTEDNTYIYIRDGLIMTKEFETNGKSIFSKDSKKILLGLRDLKNDLALYNIESKYIEQILEGKDGEVYVPESWEGEKIVYVEKNSQEKRELLVEEKDEDKLMELVAEEGDYKEIVKILSRLDRKVLTEKYGDDSILKVLDHLKERDIDDRETMLAMIELSDTFVGQEYYKYIEVLGELYLNDISNFVKALTSFEDRTDEIAYALHDLKLYERENSNLTEDLNSIVRSSDLTAKEKEVGMNLITTYAECEA